MQSQNEPMSFLQLPLVAVQEKTKQFNAVLPLPQSNTSNCAANTALLGGIKKGVQMSQACPSAGSVTTEVRPELYHVPSSFS